MCHHPVAEGSEGGRGHVHAPLNAPHLISQRLQSLDGGAPISPWTVASEVGHKNLAQIQNRYGHLAKQRQRHEGFCMLELCYKTLTDAEPHGQLSC